MRPAEHRFKGQPQQRAVRDNHHVLSGMLPDEPGEGAHPAGSHLLLGFGGFKDGIDLLAGHSLHDAALAPPVVAFHQFRNAFGEPQPDALARPASRFRPPGPAGRRPTRPIRCREFGPALRACSRPNSLSGISVCPWRRPSAFQAVSPCRTKTNVAFMPLSLPGGICGSRLMQDLRFADPRAQPKLTFFGGLGVFLPQWIPDHHPERPRDLVQRRRSNLPHSGGQGATARSDGERASNLWDSRAPPTASRIDPGKR